MWGAANLTLDSTLHSISQPTAARSTMSIALLLNPAPDFPASSHGHSTRDSSSHSRELPTESQPQATTSSTTLDAPPQPPSPAAAPPSARLKPGVRIRADGKRVIGTPAAPREHKSIWLPLLSARLTGAPGKNHVNWIRPPSRQIKGETGVREERLSVVLEANVLAVAYGETGSEVERAECWLDPHPFTKVEVSHKRCLHHPVRC